LDKGGIAFSILSSQGMIQVGDPQAQVQFGREPVKDVHKGHGVDSAGNTRQNPVAVAEHFLVGNGIRNGGDKGMGHVVLTVSRHGSDLGAVMLKGFAVSGENSF
jgi:hypothetical protein